MKVRTLGKNGFEISEVGLGCWQLGGDWGSGVSKESAFEILNEAIDQNITFLDTADVYGDGKSEQVIGEFLKGIGRPVRVATKFGRSGDVFPNRYSEDALKKSIEGSLERLGVDVIDLIQLHCIPTEELKKGDIFNWLRKVKEEGLIKEFGASVETIEEGVICMKQEGLLSLQVIFNIYRQRLLNELLPKAQEKGVGIIVRLPLASGLLSGKFSTDSQFDKNDHRNYNRNGEIFNVGETFAGLPFEKGVAITEDLKHQFLTGDMNLAQMALRWTLDHETVSCIIPGASRPEQVKSNAAVSALDPLSKEVHGALQEFYLKEVDQYIRGVY